MEEEEEEEEEVGVGVDKCSLLRRALPNAPSAALRRVGAVFTHQARVAEWGEGCAGAEEALREKGRPRGEGGEAGWKGGNNQPKGSLGMACWVRDDDEVEEEGEVEGCWWEDAVVALLTPLPS